MFANCALAVFIERGRKPKRGTVRQRAKAGVEMIEARIDQFDRDYETAKDIRQAAMRLNVGTKFVTAEQRIPAKKRVAFALEVKIFRQPIHFITTLFHPFREERLLTRALLMAKITGDEFATNRQSGVGGENHIGKSGLGRNQMNLAI